MVPIHILAGTVAIVAGFIALYSVKGLKLHRKSGIDRSVAGITAREAIQ